METKVCYTCKEHRLTTEYHKNGRGGVKSSCKYCRAIFRKSQSNGRVGKDAERNAHLKARYGITSADYKVQYEKQNGVCAICNMSSAKPLDVDHCHVTGKVRGLLCGNCNKALGLLKDNVGNLEKAIAYLMK